MSGITRLDILCQFSHNLKITSHNVKTGSATIQFLSTAKADLPLL